MNFHFCRNEFLVLPNHAMKSRWSDGKIELSDVIVAKYHLWLKLLNSSLLTGHRLQIGASGGVRVLGRNEQEALSSMVFNPDWWTKEGNQEGSFQGKMKNDTITI